jgi:hypothetical protein
MITKTEIKNEGWVAHEDCPTTTFYKGKYHLHIFKEYNQIWINKMNSTNTNFERIFAGKCETPEHLKLIMELTCYQ